MERHDEHSRAHPEPGPAPGKPGLTQPESTEQDAAGRYEGMPEEGPGAGDAARVYAEDDPNQPGTAQRHDRGGEGLVDKIRSALGQDQRQDDRPGERPSDWRDEPQAPQQAGSRDEQVTSREPTEAEAHGDSQSAAAGAPGSVGTADADTAYDAAAERKAVVPTDADTTGDASPTERAADATDRRSADETSGSGAQTSPGAVTPVEPTAVISAQDAETFQARWETIQGRFIDDPHAATEQADELVGEVMERLASLRQEYLRQLRGALGDGSDTEAMRVALQRYRAFFQLLLG
jgi:hypothetical protein